MQKKKTIENGSIQVAWCNPRPWKPLDPKLDWNYIIYTLNRCLSSCSVSVNTVCFQKGVCIITFSLAAMMKILAFKKSSINIF